MAREGIDLGWRTPAAWAAEALKDPAALLSDHAHCEKKAAVTALNLSLSLADRPRAAVLLARLAEEEMNHYRRVLEVLEARGWRLQADAGNGYAQELGRHLAASGPERLLDRLLVAALIEARSAERLALLEAELGSGPAGAGAGWLDLMRELERCEAGHAAAYLALAREAFPQAWAEKLTGWIDIEAWAIQELPWRAAIH